MVNRAATRVLHVFTNERGQFFKCEIGLTQFLRLRQDDYLLFVPAHRIDVGDTGHGAEHRFDDEILNELQFHQLLAARGRLVCRVGGVVHGILVNIAESRRDGREFGRESRGDFSQCVLQPLTDELPRAINIRAIFENERDLGEAKTRERAHFVHAVNTRQFCFERKGDQFFRFFRRERGNLRVDLHLNIGDVRHRINRQSQRRQDTAHNQPHCRQQHEHSLADGEF